MKELQLLGVAVGLAMDGFAVAVAAGAKLQSVTPRHTFRLAFHFGLFQFMMPVIGWLAGEKMSVYIAGHDHLVVFGLLSFVGVKMLWEARHSPSARPGSDPTRGLTLLGLSLATSLTPWPWV